MAARQASTVAGTSPMRRVEELEVIRHQPAGDQIRVGERPPHPLLRVGQELLHPEHLPPGRLVIGHGLSVVMTSPIRTRFAENILERCHDVSARHVARPAIVMNRSSPVQLTAAGDRTTIMTTAT
jgi:hypothetical protein